jgi:hypothetical protein
MILDTFQLSLASLNQDFLWTERSIDVVLLRLGSSTSNQPCECKMYVNQETLATQENANRRTRSTDWILDLNRWS